MESINSQLKRRTNVISIFKSKDSLLRIVTDKALDLSDEWEGINGKAYISPENLQLTAKVLKPTMMQWTAALPLASLCQIKERYHCHPIRFKWVE